MADQGDNRKKRKVSNFGLAHKALLTSTASTRFRAEDNPEETDIKHNIGASGDQTAEEWIQQQLGINADELAEADKQRLIILLSNVPKHLQREASRRQFERIREKRLAARAKEDKALGLEDQWPPRETAITREESAYAKEDNDASRIRHLLTEAVNPEVENRYIKSAGPTYLSGATGRHVASLEEQFLTASEDREAGNITGGPKGTRKDPQEFPNERVIFSEAEHGQKARAQALVTRKRELDALERRVDAGEAVVEDTTGRGVPLRLRQGIPGEQKLFPIGPATRKPIKRDLRPEMKQRIKEEREQIDRELTQSLFLPPKAVVQGRSQTPAETERTARQTVDSAFATVTDPLQPKHLTVDPERAKKFGVDTSYRAGMDTSLRPLGRIVNPKDPRSRGQTPVVTSEQLESYVQAVVDSYHHPTHAGRIQAARKAKKLGGVIAQQTQKKIKRREETAIRMEVLEELQKEHPSLTHSSYVRRSVDPVGAQPNEYLKASRQAKPQPPLPPRSNVFVDPRPFTDPRLPSETVEEVYSRYGHEDGKLKFGRGLKKHASFMRDQQHNRFDAFLKGTQILGYTKDGIATKYDTKQGYRAKVTVTPNILYEYKIRNPKEESDRALKLQESLLSLRRAPKTRENAELIARLERRVDEVAGPTTKHLPPEDMTTKFHEGRRNRFGQLIDDEYDEIVGPVKTVKQQTENFRFTFGDVEPKTGKERLPEDIDEIRYVPSPGAKGETRTLPDENKFKSVRVVRLSASTATRWWPSGQRVSSPEQPAVRGQHGAPGPPAPLLHNGTQWVPADKDTWDATPEEDRDEIPVPHQVQYKFIDPSELQLAGTHSRNTAKFRVPTIGPFHERLLHIPLSDNEDELLNKVGRPIKAYAEAQRLEAARKIATPNPAVNSGLQARYEQHLREKHGIKDKTEAKLLTEAAVAAGFYAQRKKLRDGYIPAAANTFFKKVSPKHGDDFHLAVDRSIVRPSIDRVSQIPFMLQHPFSSPTGRALGIDVDRWRYRQEGIGRQKFASRYMEKQAKQVERVMRTKRFVQAHQYERGPVGTFTRWRLDALMKHPDYKPGDEKGILTQAIKTAQEAQNEGTLHFRRASLHGEMDKIDLSDSVQEEATRRLREYAKARNRSLPSYEFKAGFTPGPGFFSRAVDHSGLERNLLIGGAVVGTAAGAAYLYHRHQETKKPQEQRVSFYNKVLPPSFETPKVFPELRVTKTIKFGESPTFKELGLAKKELPIQLGVSTKSKRFAFRPMERDPEHYKPYMPLIGRPSFKGTSGGSSKKGLIYYGNYDRSTPPTKRANIKRSTHEFRVLGKKLPGALNIGELKTVPLQSSNPRRMTGTDIDNIIWAHAGTDREEHVKAFYRGAGGVGGQRLLERWDDSDEVRKIQRQKGRVSREGRAYTRRAEREFQQVVSGAR